MISWLIAASLSAFDHLENVETQLSISGGGFSRSGMRFRPKPGENRALGFGLAGETALRSERSSSSRLQLAGEAGEVGAVLSQRADKYGLSSILKELSVQSGVSLVGSRWELSRAEESPRGVLSPKGGLAELPGVDSARGLDSSVPQDSLIEEARDLKENGFGEASSGRCFFKGRLSSVKLPDFRLGRKFSGSVLGSASIHRKFSASVCVFAVCTKGFRSPSSVGLEVEGRERVEGREEGGREEEGREEEGREVEVEGMGWKNLLSV